MQAALQANNRTHLVESVILLGSDADMITPIVSMKYMQVSNQVQNY